MKEMLKRNQRGQNIVEYAVMITIILGVLVAVGTYVKRGLQGRWKAAVDDLGDQYDPRAADSNVRQSIETNSVTSIMAYEAAEGFWTRRTDEATTTERKQGQISIEGYEE